MLSCSCSVEKACELRSQEHGFLFSSRHCPSLSPTFYRYAPSTHDGQRRLDADRVEFGGDASLVCVTVNSIILDYRVY